jgi:hypothetical protein
MPAFRLAARIGPLNTSTDASVILSPFSAPIREKVRVPADCS